MSQSHKRTNAEFPTPGTRLVQMHTWKVYLCLGTMLMIIFYWAIPAWLNHELGTLHNGTMRPIAAALLQRRISWIQLGGIVVGAIFFIFAIQNYFTSCVTHQNSSSHLKFFNRLFAWFID